MLSRCWRHWFDPCRWDQPPSLGFEGPGGRHCGQHQPRPLAPPGPFGLEACPQGSLPGVSAPQSSRPKAEATGGGSGPAWVTVAPVTAASVFLFQILRKVGGRSQRG